jgi:hypothetical protein
MVIASPPEVGGLDFYTYNDVGVGGLSNHQPCLPRGKLFGGFDQVPRSTEKWREENSVRTKILLAGRRRQPRRISRYSYDNTEVLFGIRVENRVAQNSAWNSGLLEEAEFCNSDNTEFLVVLIPT